MIEHPDQVIEGARIILSILGITECLVGIENNKPDAIAAMSSEAEKQTSAEARIEIKTLEVKYPQGAEKQLIQSVTGRRVASQGLPADHGVIVQNVSTARAIFEAVALDKPYYEKVVTISGKGIARPANLLVKVGTLVKDIVTHLGGTTEELAKVVLGGPMMGFAVSTLDIPITKTTSSILFLTRDEIDTDLFSNCIRCGRCVEACPMGLQPNEIGVYVEASQGENTTKFGTMECFECGCCAYVCPSKRPLVQFIRMAKSQLKRRAAG
jgi:electron transport complex protein RnfC